MSGSTPQPQIRAETVLPGLRRVRLQFYNCATGHPTLNKPESLQEAIQAVELWRERGSIPHAINSTAELARVTINEPSSAKYAQAFASFVTGYTDTQQKLKRKLSMFEVSKNIGLPAAYVAMRHSIVHGEMPSLIELRRFTMGALKWLWEEYWCSLDEQAADTIDGEAPPEEEFDGQKSKGVIQKMDEIIQRYLDRTIPPKNKRDRYRTEHVPPSQACRPAVKGLNTICQDQKSHISRLISLLLREGRMLPKFFVDQSDTLYQWWALIEALSWKISSFGVMLLTTLVRRMSLSSVKNANRLPYGQAVAIKAWLDYILCQEVGDRKGLRYIPVKTIIHVCLAFPGPFTTSCALQLYESSHYQGCTYEEKMLQDLQQWARQDFSPRQLASFDDNSDIRDAIDQVEEELKAGEGQWKCSLVMRPKPLGSPVVALHTSSDS